MSCEEQTISVIEDDMGMDMWGHCVPTDTSTLVCGDDYCFWPVAGTKIVYCEESDYASCSSYVEYTDAYYEPYVVSDATSMEEGIAACELEGSWCNFVVGTLTGGVTTVTTYQTDITVDWDKYQSMYIVGENSEEEAISNTDDEWQWIYLKSNYATGWDEYVASEDDSDAATYVTMGLTAAAACFAALI